MALDSEANLWVRDDNNDLKAKAVDLAPSHAELANIAL